MQRQCLTLLQTKELNEYVYINRRGTPFETQHIDSKFKYLKQCVQNEYPEDDLTDVTPHCLRHTFATQGLKSGVSIKEIHIKNRIGKPFFRADFRNINPSIITRQLSYLD